MRSCHPSITALYAAYKDARYIYLLMELAPSGNLYQMLMSMPIPPVSMAVDALAPATYRIGPPHEDSGEQRGRLIVHDEYMRCDCCR